MKKLLLSLCLLSLSVIAQAQRINWTITPESLKAQLDTTRVGKIVFLQTWSKYGTNNIETPGCLLYSLHVLNRKNEPISLTIDGGTILRVSRKSGRTRKYYAVCLQPQSNGLDGRGPGIFGDAPAGPLPWEDIATIEIYQLKIGENIRRHEPGS